MDLQHRSVLPLSNFAQASKQVAIRDNSTPHRIPTMFRNLTHLYIARDCLVWLDLIPGVQLDAFVSRKWLGTQRSFIARLPPAIPSSPTVPEAITLDQGRGPKMQVTTGCLPYKLPYPAAPGRRKWR